MVEKEDINNILTVLFSKKNLKEVIDNKCKVNRVGFNLLNNRIKGALNRFADATKGLDHEMMQCIDRQGNVLFEKEGEKNRVSWSGNDIQNALTYQEGDLINEHNHPTPYIEATNEMLETPTMLSEQDVKNLWTVDTIGYDEYGNAITGTVWRSVVAECSNGSRMTLTRTDNDPTNNVVVQDYLGREFTGERPDNNMDEFMEVYEMLNSDWKAMHRDFLSGYNDYAEEWVMTHANKESIGTQLHPQEGIVVYDNQDAYMEAYDKAMSEWSKDFVQNNRTWKGNLQFDIEAFKELGWDLSLEWR